MDPGKTIGIDLWAGQARNGANHRTCYGTAQVAVPRSMGTATMRDLFLGAYARFADLCREVDEPGIALLAVDEHTGVAAGLVRLRARVGRHVAAIVGRHDHCDLFLQNHASLALRHLAVLLDPVTSWKRGETEIRYRVFDLRTETAFTDEHGKRMRGLRAEGPAVLRVGNHAVFVLPLGDPTDWPLEGADAWAMLPERVYFDELSVVPDGSRTNLPNLSSSGRVSDRATRKSMIFRTHGPRDTGVGLVQSGDAAGMLDVIGETRTGVLTIGDAALRDGILLGRYARCDGAALLEDVSMSRVHALLVAVSSPGLAGARSTADGSAESIDDKVIVVDTASTNGTWEAGGQPTRVITVAHRTEINLGKHTRIRWHWAC